MSDMFRSCTKLANLDISNFNTSRLTSMLNMFAFCPFTSIDLSSFNTSNVTNLHGTFYSCKNLTSLDLSSFDTSQVTKTGDMLYGCTKLQTIYVSNLWILNDLTEETGMFTNCTSLVGGNGTTYDSSYTNSTYARIDTAKTPGYLTEKAITLSLRSTGNSLTGYNLTN